MDCNKNVLVTGGAGYIGSHTVVELLENDYNVIIVDSLVNSSEISIDRIRKIVNLEDDNEERLKFYEVDVRDKQALDLIFKNNTVYSVIHFAGLKAVGESVNNPLEYYNNNLISSIFLIEVMKENNVNKIVFSSSATVYGAPEFLPVTEDHKLSTTNPYGTTKLMLEMILRDVHKTSDLDMVILRYFNPIGAHKSGLLGEDPNGKPNNLLPYITQVAVGKLEMLSIFGDDYDTKDGTGVRDYIHVLDLARGHVSALNYLENNNDICDEFNLGTGIGYSVLEMVKCIEEVSGKSIPYRISCRREGDIGEVYSDATKAKEILGWEAEYGLIDMCLDSWRWQELNPNGFSSFN